VLLLPEHKEKQHHSIMRWVGCVEIGNGWALLKSVENANINQSSHSTSFLGNRV
jgi:hypothetical protein